MLRPAARLIALLLVGALDASAAEGRFRTYAFDRHDHFLTSATDYPRWAALMARHDAQGSEFAACLADVAHCPSHLRGTRTLLLQAGDLDARDRLDVINRFVNRRSPRHWRAERSERWQTLSDFLRSGGDCEDYALAKYFLLRALGVAADDLRVVIAWDRRERAHHAVLAARLDERVYLLDVDRMHTATASNAYQYLFSINEHAVWDHRADTGAMPRQTKTDG